MLNSNSDSLVMSPFERGRASVLIIEADANDRNNMRLALKNLGYGGLSDAPNHAAALERMAQRKFTHIIFDAKKTNIPVTDWLQKVLEQEPPPIAIPSSYQPNVDDVFDLMVMGARGYLVKPFTADTVEQAICMATKGDPIADVVLQAKDRNEALVAILMASVDKAATIMRQAQQFETARRELPRALNGMRMSAELARTFAKNGPEGLMEALEKFCIERSKGPATKLGRLRRALKKPKENDEAAQDAGASNSEG